MDSFNVESVSQLVTAVHQASHVKLVFKKNVHNSKSVLPLSLMTIPLVRPVLVVFT
jgi:hypothetical protein